MAQSGMDMRGPIVSELILYDFKQTLKFYKFTVKKWIEMEFTVQA